MLRDAGALDLATTRERMALKTICEVNHLDYCQFFFREVFGEPFFIGQHHIVIADVLEQVEFGEIPRLIINIPPGYTKTMEVVIMWVSRMMAKYPNAVVLHTSFSDTLVEDNSTKIRDVILSPEYQALWATAIRTDVGKKGLWRTTRGAQFLAAPAKGTITGFRAGRMFMPGEPFRFNGAMVIDDPLKPDDARKKGEREAVNNRYLNTLRSRPADERVPVIVIMQRLDEDDLSGFLLKGGSGEYWHHLMLPGLVDNAVVYPDAYTHGIPIAHGLPDGPLWEQKLNAEALAKLAKAKYVFASQIQQNPLAAGGKIFLEEYFRFCRRKDQPNLEYRVIYADTAQKEGEQNDYSVFQHWGKGTDGKAYLLGQVRGKWTAPQLQSNAKAFWSECKKQDAINGRGILRVMKIEDKVSGTTLIQTLPTEAGGNIPVEAIPREKDKWTRAMDVEPSFANGLVVFPVTEEEPWMKEYLAELLAFPGTFDDQVDPTMDAVVEMVGQAADLMSLL